VELLLSFNHILSNAFFGDVAKGQHCKERVTMQAARGVDFIVLDGIL